MRVEIWSDFACPWCCIGRRRFEKALGGYEHAGGVEVVWRSFELDPEAPRTHEGDPTEALAAKYQMTLEQAAAAQARVAAAADGEGLDFHLGAVRRGNTFDAHRLAHFADARGSGEALRERLFTAYFSEGRALGDREALVDLAGEAQLDAEEARAMLGSDAFMAEVRADEAAATSLGIRSVPCFVFDREFALSGAQSPDVILDVLERGRPPERRVPVG